MADPKPASVKYVQMVYPDTQAHMFRTIDEVTNGQAACEMHGGKVCTLPKDPADVCLIGSPCQPFSLMRSNRRAVPAHRRKDLGVLFGDFIMYLRTRRPRGGAVENVLGLATQLPTGVDDDGNALPASWLARLVQLLRELGYSAAVTKLNNGHWVDAARERLCILSPPSHKLSFSPIPPPLSFSLALSPVLSLSLGLSDISSTCACVLVLVQVCAWMRMHACGACVRLCDCRVCFDVCVCDCLCVYACM